MELASRLKMYSLQAMLLLPVALAMQCSAHAAPAALSTLDVCHNEVTGNWRYSGMVAVSGANVTSTTLMGVDYWVQNSSSDAGFVDVLKVPAQPSLSPLATVSTARLARFETEAAPYSVGSLRNSARISLVDPLAASVAPLLLMSTAAYTESVCGCPHVTGCTRTQGYWKRKPGVVWPAPYSRDALFFSSGLSWQQIMDAAPQGGNAYLILAHQYIAALLNRASGASAPVSVQTIINNAGTWFSSGTTLATCSGAACDTQKNWAAMLDTYNNGEYPGAPRHCPD